MRIALVAAAAALALSIPTTVLAQNAPLEYYQDLAKAGGQADALSMACGKTTQAAVDAHKAKLRQNFAGHGLTPASFNGIYDAAYKSMMTQTRANPAQTKQGCARLANFGRQ